MLYLIQIHWQRRTPEAGRPDSGISTYAGFGRSLNAAITKTKTKFHRHFGLHLAVTAATEKQDPAAIFQSGGDHRSPHQPSDPRSPIPDPLPL